MAITPEQDRYARALSASRYEAGRKQRTRDHDMWFQTNHKILTKHAPSEGASASCAAEDCGKPWPCDVAETAMREVGVTA